MARLEIDEVVFRTLEVLKRTSSVLKTYVIKMVVFVTCLSSNRTIEKSCATNPWQNSV